MRTTSHLRKTPTNKPIENLSSLRKTSDFWTARVNLRNNGAFTGQESPRMESKFSFNFGSVSELAAVREGVSIESPMLRRLDFSDLKKFEAVSIDFDEGGLDQDFFGLEPKRSTSREMRVRGGDFEGFYFETGPSSDARSVQSAKKQRVKGSSALAQIFNDSGISLSASKNRAVGVSVKGSDRVKVRNSRGCSRRGLLGSRSFTDLSLGESSLVGSTRSQERRLLGPRLKRVQRVSQEMEQTQVNSVSKARAEVSEVLNLSLRLAKTTGWENESIAKPNAPLVMFDKYLKNDTPDEINKKVELRDFPDLNSSKEEPAGLQGLRLRLSWSGLSSDVRHGTRLLQNEIEEELFRITNRIEGEGVEMHHSRTCTLGSELGSNAFGRDHVAGSGKNGWIKAGESAQDFKSFLEDRPNCQKSVFTETIIQNCGFEEILNVSSAAKASDEGVLSGKRKRRGSRRRKSLVEPIFTEHECMTPMKEAKTGVDPFKTPLKRVLLSKETPNTEPSDSPNEHTFSRQINETALELARICEQTPTEGYSFEQLIFYFVMELPLNPSKLAKLTPARKFKVVSHIMAGFVDLKRAFSKFEGLGEFQELSNILEGAHAPPVIPAFHWSQDEAELARFFFCKDSDDDDLIAIAKNKRLEKLLSPPNLPNLTSPYKKSLFQARFGSHSNQDDMENILGDRAFEARLQATPRKHRTHSHPVRPHKIEIERDLEIIRRLCCFFKKLLVLTVCLLDLMKVFLNHKLHEETFPDAGPRHVMFKQALRRMSPNQCDFRFPVPDELRNMSVHELLSCIDLSHLQTYIIFNKTVIKKNRYRKVSFNRPGATPQRESLILSYDEHARVFNSKFKRKDELTKFLYKYIKKQLFREYRDVAREAHTGRRAPSHKSLVANFDKTYLSDATSRKLYYSENINKKTLGQLKKQNPVIAAHIIDFIQTRLMSDLVNKFYSEERHKIFSAGLGLVQFSQVFRHHAKKHSLVFKDCVPALVALEQVFSFSAAL